MNKSSIEKVLKADGHYSSDLVSLDFKSQSLQKFLENVAQLINTHSQKINQLEMEKINLEQIDKDNTLVMNATKLSPTILKEIPSIKHPKHNKEHADIVEDISSNLKEHSQALQYTLDLIGKKQQKIDTLSNNIGSFQTIERSDESMRKTIQTAKKYTDDEITKVLTRLKDLEMKNNKKISEFENTTKDLEKKTLWKINQCETTLSRKITSDYVDKAVEQFQTKILNNISNNKNQQLNELNFNLETIKTKLQSLQKDVEIYERQNKQLFVEIKEDFKTVQKKDKSQEDRRDWETKIKELLLKIDKLEKRQDPQELELRMTKITAEHHEKLKTHGDKLYKLDVDLGSINGVMSSVGGSSGTMDPHKLCQIDGDVRRLRDSNRTNQSKLQTLEEEIKTKLLIFEERIMTTLGMLKGQDNFVSREEMYESLSRLREPVTERMNENQNLINELHSKINKLEMFEKATKRKIKQMTRGDELNKILDMKLNISQAEVQFSAYNMQLENLEIIFNKIKMEVQASSSFLKILQEQMNEPQEGINIIGPKQKIFPAKCLGCGQKHIPPVYDNNMMQGTDGKYYRVDLKNSNPFDNKEVYGVTPSQVAIYDTTTKKRIISAGGCRPTSSRTNIRPNSAAKF